MPHPRETETYDCLSIDQAHILARQLIEDAANGWAVLMRTEPTFRSGLRVHVAYAPPTEH